MQKSVFAILFSAMMIAPAFAQEAATPTSASAPPAATSTSAAVQPLRGQRIMSADGHLIGRVYDIRSDGAVTVIYNDRLVSIALTTLSASGADLVTTLTRSQVADMTRH